MRKLVKLLFLTLSVLTAREAIAADMGPPIILPDPAHLAHWTTPKSGELVTVVRNGTDYRVPIPLSFRLCSKIGVETLNVWYGKSNLPNQTGQETPSILLPPGKCLQVDQPIQITVQVGTSTFRSQSGTYEYFPKGTFPKSPEIVDAVKSESLALQNARSHQVIHLGAAKLRRASCMQFNDPKPNEDAWGKCAVKGIKNGGSYRVCFGKDLSAFPDYPSIYIPMALDPKIARKKANPNYVNDRRFKGIYSNSCRDVFNVKDLYFVVRPQSTNDPWNPKNVQYINFYIQRIKIKKS